MECMYNGTYTQLKLGYIGICLSIVMYNCKSDTTTDILTFQRNTLWKEKYAVESNNFFVFEIF